MAACVCMVEHARGAPVDENALLGSWADDRLPSGTFDWSPAEEHLGRKRQFENPDDEGFVSWLRLRLSGETCAIAWVFRDEYRARVVPPDLSSPHGALETFHHAVVLFFEGGNLRVLDPFFPGSGQPLRLGDEDVPAVLTGELLFVACGP